MFPGYYFSTPNTSDISLADNAKLFGTAVALPAADATLVGYGSNHYPAQFRRGDAVLAVMQRFQMDDGTATVRAVGAKLFRGQLGCHFLRQRLQPPRPASAECDSAQSNRG